MNDLARGRDQVRASLIAAAAKLLEMSPPTRVTAKEIANLAGVNHGQIHHYFGSKDGLVAATVREGAATYRRELLAEGQRFPLPIQAARPSGWRTLAYLALSEAWRRPPFEPSPVIASIVERRALDRGEPTDSIDVLAEVAGTLALQRGWWFFGDLIEATLADYDLDVERLHHYVGRWSTRLVDDSHDRRVEYAVTTPAVLPELSAVPEVAEKLVDAAVSLLSDHAPDAVTAKGIAEVAGVNHGQIHHYFTSKDRLIAHALQRQGRALVAGAMGGGTRLRVPIDATRRSPMWRTLTHLALTDEGLTAPFQPSPVITAMVQVVAEYTGLPVSDPRVHAQVALLHALELGWDAYRDVIEFSLQPFASDLAPVRDRLSEISVRLVLDPVEIAQDA